MKTQRTAMQDFHGASVANASWFHLGQRVVVVDAAEFDAFMEAHRSLLQCALDAVYEEAEDPSHDNLSVAIHDMQQLEGGEE